MMEQQTVRTEYTREELIELCDRAVVPEAYWSNRDHPFAQMEVGSCRALLKAGCEYILRLSDREPGRGSDMVTTADFIWLEFPLPYVANPQTYYIPTEMRIELSEGRHW